MQKLGNVFCILYDEMNMAINSTTTLKRNLLKIMILSLWKTKPNKVEKSTSKEESNVVDINPIKLPIHDLEINVHNSEQ